MFDIVGFGGSWHMRFNTRLDVVVVVVVVACHAAVSSFPPS